MKYIVVMLQILACKKDYNGREVLNIPSLELNKGIYWLQGINGSGKTTLLRMIAGLIPFKGDILLNGISLRSNPFEYRRHVSLAEAEPLFPPFITGQELVNFYQSTCIFCKIRELTDIRFAGVFLRRFWIDFIGAFISGMC